MTWCPLCGSLLDQVPAEDGGGWACTNRVCEAAFFDDSQFEDEDTPARDRVMWWDDAYRQLGDRVSRRVSSLPPL